MTGGKRDSMEGYDGCEHGGCESLDDDDDDECVLREFSVNSM